MPDGLGTALKPAHEPIVVARKPLVGTVAGNVLAHGTGAINVDGCRVGSDGGVTRHTASLGEHRDRWEGNQATGEVTLNGGRWPANVVLGHSEECRQVGTQRVKATGAFPSSQAAEVGIGPSHIYGDAAGITRRERIQGDADGMETVEAWACVPDCPVRLLDEQTGTLVSGANPTRRGSDKFHTAYGDFVGERKCEPARGRDTGGASRFFYCAKASRAERGPGNTHPTVKPIDLMRWLVRLVTPPGGLVLDPFAGSGTTGIAALREGFSFVGVEREAEYVALARERIRGDAPLLNAAREAVVA